MDGPLWDGRVSGFKALPLERGQRLALTRPCLFQRFDGELIMVRMYVAEFGPTPTLTDIPREQCLRCALSNETGSDNTTKFLAANPPQL